MQPHPTTLQIVVELVLFTVLLVGIVHIALGEHRAGMARIRRHNDRELDRLVAGIRLAKTLEYQPYDWQYTAADVLLEQHVVIVPAQRDREA